MIWENGICSVPGYGAFCVELVEWFDPPWSAMYFDRGDGQEAAAKAACAEECLKRETAFFATRMRRVEQMDDGA